jgi:DNA-binding NarL/FixJ family response regulator
MAVPACAAVSAFAAFHAFLTSPLAASKLDAPAGRGEDSVLRVLLVDDEDRMRRALRYLLEAEDIEVVGEAGDGAEAVALTGELVPDVVVMDLRLPTMDGLEATRRIRREVPATQVVIFTAQDDTRLQQQASDAGAYACLAKGCSGDELVGLIHEADAAGRRSQPAAHQHA